jgi:D-alanine-D-alanine ligase-like ATP-grasp enzyme
VINKAGNIMSDKKDKNQTAMEVVQPQLISSYFLRDIPFFDLIQPIQLSDGTSQAILQTDNNNITGCNIEALQMYINSKTNIDPDIKKERQNYINTYNTKSDTDKEKIQQLFI